MKRRDLIAGRVVLGIGMDHLTELSRIGADFFVTGTVLLGPSAQSYAVEMSHPAHRGLMVGAYQACFFLGTSKCACALCAHDCVPDGIVSRFHLGRVWPDV
jgi:hypothetical protein